eukprot:SAG11_NODE_3560_length_2371_cov_2.872359_2_plen_186_part_00
MNMGRGVGSACGAAFAVAAFAVAAAVVCGWYRAGFGQSSDGSLPAALAALGALGALAGVGAVVLRLSEAERRQRLEAAAVAQKLERILQAVQTLSERDESSFKDGGDDERSEAGTVGALAAENAFLRKELRRRGAVLADLTLVIDIGGTRTKFLIHNNDDQTVQPPPPPPQRVRAPTESVGLRHG